MSRRSIFRTRIAVKIDAAGAARRSAADYAAQAKVWPSRSNRLLSDAARNKAEARFYVRGARQDRLEFVGGQA
jgi:hypothetical protein